MGAVGLGDGQHVSAADIAVVDERYLGQIQRAVGVELAGRKPAVGGMIRAFAAAQNRVQVALRAQDLLGTERAVLVRAARAHERARVHDHGLALRAMHRLHGEIAGHAGGGCRALLDFGRFQLASLAVFVDDRGVDGFLGVLGKRPAHQRKVACGGGFSLIACRHGLSLRQMIRLIVHRSSWQARRSPMFLRFNATVSKGIPSAVGGMGTVMGIACSGRLAVWLRALFARLSLVLGVLRRVRARLSQVLGGFAAFGT